MKKTIIAPEAKLKHQRVELDTDSSQYLSDQEKDAKRNSEARALRSHELRQKFVTLADQVAESNLYFRNWKYKEGDQMYPHDPDSRMVTKSYPHAKGGLLFVDEPRNQREMVKSYEKQKVLKKLGYRFIVIEADTTLYDCLEQLGEL